MAEPVVTLPQNMHTDLRDMQKAAKDAAESAEHSIHKVSQRVYIECSCGFNGATLVTVYPKKLDDLTCPNCGTDVMNDTGKPVTNMRKGN